MGEFVTKDEHAEFSRRMDEANQRQSERISKVESALEELGGIVRSVDKLASNMEHMLEEQRSQGKRLTAIENKDGDMWRTAIKYALTAAVGILVGYIFKHLGF